jgi:hypothetical protein
MNVSPRWGEYTSNHLARWGEAHRSNRADHNRHFEIPINALFTECMV